MRAGVAFQRLGRHSLRPLFLQSCMSPDRRETDLYDTAFWLIVVTAQPLQAANKGSFTFARPDCSSPCHVLSDDADADAYPPSAHVIGWTLSFFWVDLASAGRYISMSDWVLGGSQHGRARQGMQKRFSSEEQRRFIQSSIRRRVLASKMYG